MSDLARGGRTISKEKSQQCDGCGRVRELRPYGPHGSCICFECAMKDERETERRFSAILRAIEEVRDEKARAT